MAMLIGQTITAVRALTTHEADAQGWAHATCKRTVALVLSNGTVVFAASSANAEGPGALFAEMKNGESLMIRVPRREFAETAAVKPDPSSAADRQEGRQESTPAAEAASVRAPSAARSAGVEEAEEDESTQAFDDSDEDDEAATQAFEPAPKTGGAMHPPPARPVKQSNAPPIDEEATVSFGDDGDGGSTTDEDGVDEGTAKAEKAAAPVTDDDATVAFNAPDGEDDATQAFNGGDSTDEEDMFPDNAPSNNADSQASMPPPPARAAAPSAAISDADATQAFDGGSSSDDEEMADLFKHEKKSNSAAPNVVSAGHAAAGAAADETLAFDDDDDDDATQAFDVDGDAADEAEAMPPPSTKCAAEAARHSDDDDDDDATQAFAADGGVADVAKATPASVPTRTAEAALQSDSDDDDATQAFDDEDETVDVSEAAAASAATAAAPKSSPARTAGLPLPNEDQDDATIAFGADGDDDNASTASSEDMFADDDEQEGGSPAQAATAPTAKKAVAPEAASGASRGTKRKIEPKSTARGAAGLANAACLGDDTVETEDDTRKEEATSESSGSKRQKVESEQADQNTAQQEQAWEGSGADGGIWFWKGDPKDGRVNWIPYPRELSEAIEASKLAKEKQHKVDDERYIIFAQKLQRRFDDPSRKRDVSRKTLKVREQERKAAERRAAKEKENQGVSDNDEGEGAEAEGATSKPGRRAAAAAPTAVSKTKHPESANATAATRGSRASGRKKK